MKRVLIFTLTAILLCVFCLGLCSCKSEDEPETIGEFVAIEGDKISGTWIVGGTGMIDDARLDKIVPAYNGLTEFKNFEKVDEADAVMRLVIFSDHGEDGIDIFKITYIGDNTFSIETEGSVKSSYNAVSPELFKAITEVTE